MSETKKCQYCSPEHYPQTVVCIDMYNKMHEELHNYIKDFSTYNDEQYVRDHCKFCKEEEKHGITEEKQYMCIYCDKVGDYETMEDHLLWYHGEIVSDLLIKPNWVELRQLKQVNDCELIHKNIKGSLYEYLYCPRCGEKLKEELKQ